MKTLELSYTDYDGKTIRNTAVVSDDLRDLVETDANEAFDLFDILNETWVISFWNEKNEVVEYHFDIENGERTLNALWVLIWDEQGVIEDYDDFELTIK